MKCRAHNLLLTWHRTQGVNLNSIPCGAQAWLLPATGVSPFYGNCRGKLPCYCFWLPVGFSWPASMDGTFTSLGCPGSLAPPLPRHCLQRGLIPSRPYCYPQTFLPLCTPSGLWSLTLLTLSSPPSI